MDERIKRRRAQVRREKGQTRGLIFLLIFLCCLTLALFVWFRTSDVLAVERAVLRGELVHTEKQQITQVLQAVKGQNLIALDTGLLRRHLLRLPYVKEARVWRKFPDSIEIEVTEYKPAARFKVLPEGDIFVVSEDGRVLDEANDQQGLLPLVAVDAKIAPQIGSFLPDHVRQLLSDLITALGLEHSTRNIEVVFARFSGSALISLSLQLKEGVEIQLGDKARLKQKLRSAFAVYDYYQKQGKRLAYIDASTPDRVAVKLR